MNDFVKAIIIGVVEGLTEFIPVSSTAHIRITQDFLGIPAKDEFWKMFAIVIQLGAIIAVLVYFAKRLIDFTKSFFTPMDSLQARLRHPFSLVIISFVVTALPCYLMDKWSDANLENPLAIALALLIGGILMWVIDYFYGNRFKTDRMDQMSLTQAIAIGAAQILAATFPGTSRSMATIGAGQVMGLSRPAALEFSFFLSIPVMLAATAYKLLKFILESPEGMNAHQMGVLAVGFVVSFIVALAVIAWLMNWVKKHGFVPFAIYRIVIAIILLAWLLR